jgi:lantibiotic modifying enzyme
MITGNQKNKIDKSKYLKCLEQIANKLIALNPVIYEKGLMNGKMGLVLFFFHYSRAVGEKKYSDLAFSILEKSFIFERNNPHVCSFSSGVAGIGCVLEHLVNDNFIEAETNSLLSEIDTLLIQTIKHDINNLNTDFLYGCVGTGLYFLYRKNINNRSKILGELIDGLYNSSFKSGKGRIFWVNKIGESKFQNTVDLGLAHGNPAVLVLLSKIFNNIKSKEVEGLIQSSLNFIDGIKRSSNSGSLYGYKTRNNIDDGEMSRLAWCYGDLSVAISIWHAAHALNNESFKNKSIEIVRHSLGRTSFKDTLIDDFGICHGTAGVAHLYCKFYKYTKIKDFDFAAEFWIKKTIEGLNFQDSFTNSKNNVNVIQEDGTFLSGLSGIGLVLLSYLFNEDSWDKLLLVS